MTLTSRMLALVLLVSAPLLASSDKITLGTFSGRMWRSLHFPEKVSFLYGLQSGFYIGVPAGVYGVAVAAGEQGASVDQETASTIMKAAEKHSMPVFGTMADQIDFLDKFFQTSENRLLTVPNGLQILMMKQNGESDTAVEDELLHMRSKAAVDHRDR